MNEAVDVDPAAQAALFAHLTQLLCALVAARALERPSFPDRLNDGLETGAVLTLSFDIGGAGPLGFRIDATRPDGATMNVMTIDAPASTEAFRFAEA